MNKVLKNLLLLVILGLWLHQRNSVSRALVEIPNLQKAHEVTVVNSNGWSKEDAAKILSRIDTLKRQGKLDQFLGTS